MKTWLLAVSPRSLEYPRVPTATAVMTAFCGRYQAEGIWEYEIQPDLQRGRRGRAWKVQLELFRLDFVDLSTLTAEERKEHHDAMRRAAAKLSMIRPQPPQLLRDINS